MFRPKAHFFLFYTVATLLCLAVAPSVSAKDVQITADGAVETGVSAASSRVPAGKGGDNPTVIPVEQLDDIASILKDERARSELLKRIEVLSVLAAERKQKNKTAQENFSKRLAFQLGERVTAMTEDLSEILEAMLSIPERLERTVQAVGDPVKRARWMDTVARLAAIIAAVVIVAYVSWLLAGTYVRRILRLSPRGILPSAVAFGGRLGLRLLPIGAFVAIAYFALPFAGLNSNAQLIFLTFVHASALLAASLAISFTVLEPETLGSRVLPIESRTAGYLHIWIRRFLIFGAYGYLALETLLVLGLQPVVYSALLNLLGLIILGIGIVFVLQNRVAVAAQIKVSDASARFVKIRNWIARFWHLVVIGYAVLFYVLWAFEARAGFSFVFSASVWTAFILIGARFINLLLRSVMDRVLSVPSNLATRFPDIEERVNRFLPNLRQALHWLINAVAVLMVVDVWGLDVSGWLESQSGGIVIGKTIAILGIIFAGWLIWELTSAVIEAKIRRTAAADSSVAMRWQTVLPLLRISLRIFIFTLVILIALSEVGVEIGPLIAAAGVVGLAIGFGAQTLVKDLINGLFILIEDIIAVGDWIDIGGRRGKVEAMSVRTLTLRDVEGFQHVIPFSDISSLMRAARDYSFALIEAGVAYREDTDKVVDVLKAIGQDMRADPVWGKDIVDDLEIMGLHALADSSVVLRVRLKTLPQRQFAVRREFQRRMKAAFDVRGIEIPFPHTTLYFGQDKEGKAPVAHVEVMNAGPA